MATKREREKQIQAWFDPEQGNEQAVIEAFEALRADNWPTKAIIGNGILSLAEQHGKGKYRPMTTNEMLTQETQERIQLLFSAIDKLTEVLETGTSIPREAHDAISGYKRARDNFNAVEESMAARYQPLVFDDEPAD